MLVSVEQHAWGAAHSHVGALESTVESLSQQWFQSTWDNYLKVYMDPLSKRHLGVPVPSTLNLYIGSLISWRDSGGYRNKSHTLTTREAKAFLGGFGKIHSDCHRIGP